MDANAVIEIEKKISELTGRQCYIEYYRYDGAKRMEADKPYGVPDGLLKDKLSVLPGYYHNDYVFSVTSHKQAGDEYPEERIIAGFRLYQLPGCCGVCVSSGASTSYAFRKKGINTLLNKFRMELAKHMGYSVLLCSDVSTNAASKRTLEKNGWKDVHQFKNIRTSNTVDISLISLA